MLRDIYKDNVMTPARVGQTFCVCHLGRNYNAYIVVFI